jgi:hypothetical protein
MFTTPDSIRSTTIVGLGTSSTVTNLVDVEELKPYDYCAIQADGMDIRYTIHSTVEPDATTGIVVPDQLFSRDILSAADIARAKVYGTFNLLAYPRPPKTV